MKGRWGGGDLWLPVIIMSWGAGRRDCKGIFVFECHVSQSMFTCCICCISENIVYKKKLKKMIGVYSFGIPPPHLLYIKIGFFPSYMHGLFNLQRECIVRCVNNFKARFLTKRFSIV